MKISEGPQLTARAPAIANPAAKAIAERASQVMLARWARCAILSTCIYGSDVEKWAAADVEEGRFFDRDLDLRAAAEIHEGHAFIAFRGTVGAFLLSANWWGVNLKTGWTGADPPVHGGFWRAWLALKSQILKWLKANRPTSIYLTGHSMGAALAQLAALDLHAAWPITRVILFATPMVGGAPFNAKYASVGLESRTTRYLLLTDAITVPLPRLLGFAPPASITRIDKNGMNATGRPGVLRQAGSMVVGQGPQFIGPGIWSPFGTPEPLAVEEELMPNARLFALSSGTLTGWLAPIGLALLSVFRRAVGYHSMVGYATALHVGSLTRIVGDATWEGRWPLSSTLSRQSAVEPPLGSA